MDWTPSTKTQNIDVLIIGAGPVGLVAALWFLQKGYSVVIIEKYANPKGVLQGSQGRKCFNERHQQVGLNPESLDFIQKLNPGIIKEIKRDGCPDPPIASGRNSPAEAGTWLNIAIYNLQNIIYTELITYKKFLFLCDSQIESVTTINPAKPARVIVSRFDDVYSFYPEFVVVCDGRHKDGCANQFFHFGPASQVTLSSLGIIGMIRRDSIQTICYKNHSFENYKTPIGEVHVRLLGSNRERYIALGAIDDTSKINMEKLTPQEIKQILLKVFQELKDSEEPQIETFSEISKTPIQIVLDYRKETIKIFEGSNTIVTIEGDAARKTTFFSGSGLNSAYKALGQLFSFCDTYAELIFRSHDLLHIDEALLEKDQASLQVSMELLRKGIKFVLTPDHKCPTTH